MTLPSIAKKAKQMAPPPHILLFLLLFFLTTTTTTTSFLLPAQSEATQLGKEQEAFTSISISQKGLDFLKELLVTKAISSIVHLKLPQIEKTDKIPFLGSVRMVLSNLTIEQIKVSNSYLKSGDTGVVVIASGTTCNLSMSWYYEYSIWLFPLEIVDRGTASVQVEGMEVGLTLGLEDQEGTLKMSLLDCGCYVKDISIKLDGGASWLYQGMIDAFEDQIRSAVENAISKKLEEGILKLDAFLQALPKEIPVDDTASLNVTFVDDPWLSYSSIGFKINGLFIPRRTPSTIYHIKNSQPLVSCSEPTKMLGISLDEAVFSSASALYYDAKFVQWIVDEVPDQYFLNTAGWRFIIPQLYKKYPNDDMNMNITLSSPPVIRISDNDIDATVSADLIIDVLESEQVIPVACVSLVIRGSGSVKVIENNIGGSVKLNDFSMSLKWSKIGNLRMYLIQPVIRTIIQTVFVPYANVHLAKGFPLPIIHGFALQNAEIICAASTITVCGDVAYEEEPHRHVYSF